MYNIQQLQWWCLWHTQASWVQDTIRVCWISESTKWQSCHYLWALLL